MTHEQALAKLGEKFGPATYRRVVAFLSARPSMIEPIAEHLGMSVPVARVLIANMKRIGVVCVVEFVPRGHGNGLGGPRRMYGLGSEDAKPMTAAEKLKRWRDAVAADEVREAMTPNRPPAPPSDVVRVWGI